MTSERGMKGHGNIRQLGSGRWQLRVPRNGKLVSYGTYETEAEAIRAQARWILTGLLPKEDPDYLEAMGLSKPAQAAMQAGGRTHAELFEEWQAEKMSRREVTEQGKLSGFRDSKRKRGGARSTARNNRAHWNAWWAKSIGPKSPGMTDKKDYMGVLRAIENKWSKGTAKTHLSMIKAYLNWLVEQGYLSENPLGSVAYDFDPANDRVREVVVPDFDFIEILSDVFGTTLFRDPSKRNKTGYVGVSHQKPRGNRKGGYMAYYRTTYLGLFPTAEEAAEAVREARGLKDGTSMDRLIFELLIQTGGRRSEVAGIRIKEVERRRIRIDQPVITLGGAPERQETTKSYKARSVTLSKRLRKLIDAELARRGAYGPDDPLVTSPTGGLVNFNNWIDDRLIPALKMAVERWKPLEIKRLVAEEEMTLSEAEAVAEEESMRLMKLRPHHLRHTAAALMIAAGVPDAEIQLTLGHSDLEFTRKIYMHVLESEKYAHADRVEDMRRARREGEAA